MQRIRLEVCISSLADAVAAVAGGADRLELNSALELGGLTPALSLIPLIHGVVSSDSYVPLGVMLRPRPGGFCYDRHYLTQLFADLSQAQDQGADFVVIGLLTADGLIDERAIEKVVSRSELPVVFSRAFDLVPDPLHGLTQLINLGINRVMTSGQEANAIRGQALIKQLIAAADDQIEILPAGGIKPDNVQSLIAATGATQVHASLRKTKTDSSNQHRPQIHFGVSTLDESTYRETDPEQVQEMRQLLDAINHEGSA
jgi:copper homeostasis protein